MDNEVMTIQPAIGFEPDQVSEAALGRLPAAGGGGTRALQSSAATRSWPAPCHTRLHWKHGHVPLQLGPCRTRGMGRQEEEEGAKGRGRVARGGAHPSLSRACALAPRSAASNKAGPAPSTAHWPHQLSGPIARAAWPHHRCRLRSRSSAHRRRTAPPPTSCPCCGSHAACRCQPRVLALGEDEDTPWDDLGSRCGTSASLGCSMLLTTPRLASRA